MNFKSWYLILRFILKEQNFTEKTDQNEQCIEKSTTADELVFEDDTRIRVSLFLKNLVLLNKMH